MQSASKVPFLALCRVLEAIQHKKAVPEKKAILAKFIAEWRAKSFDINNVDDSFYPILRCIVPQLEKIAYGLKEHSLGRLYVEVMGLGKSSDAANRLMNYKKPISSISHKTVGDFAECAYEVIKDRCSSNSALSVMDVIDKLNDIANGYTASDRKLVRSTLEYLIRNLNGLENKWFIRMLVKDMKLGLGQDSVLTIFHPDAPDLFSVDTNLERVCKKLRDLNKRLHEIEVSLFAHLKPMLGKQAKPNEAEHLFKGGEFYIEQKFDGERMQLHKKDGEYKYFSRNGFEFTSTYGSDKYSGNLTPKVDKQLQSVQSCILDGEMCGYDTELQVFGTKAMSFDIKSANLTRYTPCYIVFDVLYLNGETLTNKSLKERKQILQKLFEPVEGLIMISQVVTATTNVRCLEALNQAIERYEEGIMIKDPKSIYKPNSRTSGWYKIKPEYVDGLMDELDILIIGGYFGKGRRSNVISHFLCAVKDERTTPSNFISVCRVGSGYSYKELLDFNIKLKPKWIKSKPSNVHVSKEKPDVYLETQQSHILQVKATEVVESSQFSTGFTLRFPRVMKIREDKNYNDCLTLTEFTNMRTKRQGQLAGSNLLSLFDDDDDDDSPKKKKRKTPAVRAGYRAPVLAARFQPADVTGVDKEGVIFEEKEICVISGDNEFSKQKIETEIVRLGGTAVQHAGPNTYCIITDRINIRARNYSRSGKYNLLKVDWIKRCILDNQLYDWHPFDMLAQSSDIKDKFRTEFDEFGDGYYSNVNTNTLKQIFNLIKQQSANDQEKTTELNKTDILEIEEENMIQTTTNCSLFRDTRLLISDDCKSDSRVELTVLKSRFYGAETTDSLQTATHCITERRNECVHEHNMKESTRKMHQVTVHWLSDCIENGKLVGERDYPPV